MQIRKSGATNGSNMREDFLHYIWRLGQFNMQKLTTTQGESISLQHLGEHNRNAGPDFLGAQLRIGRMQWAGQVEMHLRASEWLAHGHQHDPAYDNVILHVVLEEDEIILNRQGHRIPCLELKGRIPAGLLRSYWRLMNQAYWIPCQHQIAGISKLRLHAWLDRLLVERLQEQSDRLAIRLKRKQNDWESAFYESIARSLGGRINNEAMDMLARSVPLKLALRHKHSLLQLEALYFGQSGLLPDAGSQDEYVHKLQREYQLLAHKYGLRPLPATSWRYLRLRPNNFPTIRIAQLATLVHQSGHLFSKVMVAANVRELAHTFDLKVSHYWKTHYRFGKPAARAVEKRLGKQMVHSICINAVVPALWLYGLRRSQQAYQDKALHILAQLPAERNAQIQQWQKMGIEAKQAADTQALLRLKSTYCDHSRCLDCAIGCHILGRGSDQFQPVLTLNEEAQLYQMAEAV